MTTPPSERKASDGLAFKFLWALLETISSIAFDINEWCDKQFKKLEALDEQPPKETP